MYEMLRNQFSMDKQYLKKKHLKIYQKGPYNGIWHFTSGSEYIYVAAIAISIVYLIYEKLYEIELMIKKIFHTS